MKAEIETVINACRGDKDAFAKLYYCFYKDFYNFALYSLGNPEDAADVVADAFVEIWRNIGKLRSPEAFSAWAFKILSIRCKNEISKKAERRGFYNFEELTEIPSPGSENFEDEIAESTILAAALGELNPEERMIVVLSVIYGYTRREISKIIGKPQGTVGSKLFRAYEKLKKFMEQRSSAEKRSSLLYIILDILFRRQSQKPLDFLLQDFEVPWHFLILAGA